MRTGDLDDNDTLEPLFVVLRRRWKIIVVCVLLGLAASIAVSEMQQTEYTASASILFRDSGVDQELFGYSAAQPSNDQASQAATNMALVSLPVVASRTAAALHVSGSAVSSAISVSGVGQANIAQINATDPDPVLAARIANTYARQYVLLRREADAAQVSSAQELVQKELRALSPAERFDTVGQGLRTRANQLMELSAVQTGNAEVAQPAVVPTSPSAPQTKHKAVIGLLVSLLLGLGLAFLAERFDRRIRDPAELEDAYGVAVLSDIPISGAIATSGLASGASAEAFGTLRARLRSHNLGQDVRSLVITSALPLEGKTTIAVNLAAAEAAAGRTETVLVEADLRHPRLERYLGLAAGPGLTDVLTREASLGAAIRGGDARDGNHDGASADFSVITAGALSPNPIELLESRAMAELLSALSEQFDLVILDTPPPSVVPDAIPLIRLVTGVVIVARKNMITRDAARQLRDQLTNLRAPTLGVVANAMPANSARYPEYTSTAHPAEGAPTLTHQPRQGEYKRSRSLPALSANFLQPDFDTGEPDLVPDVDLQTSRPDR